jgi:hypothetical protein
LASIDTKTIYFHSENHEDRSSQRIFPRQINVTPLTLSSGHAIQKQHKRALLWGIVDTCPSPTNNDKRLIARNQSLVANRAIAAPQQFANMFEWRSRPRGNAL